MEEQQKVESGEQEEEKELTAKEKIELERQEEAKLRQKFPMAGRPGLPGKPAGGNIFALHFCIAYLHCTFSLHFFIALLHCHFCIAILHCTIALHYHPTAICRSRGPVELFAETNGQEH